MKKNQKKSSFFKFDAFKIKSLGQVFGGGNILESNVDEGEWYFDPVTGTWIKKSGESDRRDVPPPPPPGPQANNSAR
jgi:hypothetical protein